MPTRTRRARRRFGGDLPHLPADLDRGDPGFAAEHPPGDERLDADEARDSGETGA